MSKPFDWQGRWARSHERAFGVARADKPAATSMPAAQEINGPADASRYVPESVVQRAAAQRHERAKSRLSRIRRQRS